MDNGSGPSSSARGSSTSQKRWPSPNPNNDAAPFGFLGAPRPRPRRLAAPRPGAQAHHQLGVVTDQPAAQPRHAHPRRGRPPPHLPPPAHVLQLLRRHEDSVPVDGQVAGPHGGPHARAPGHGGARRRAGKRRRGDDAGAGGDAAVKSAVYEAPLIKPPVPMQYGRAKRDMVRGGPRAGHLHLCRPGRLQQRGAC